jgi:membrane protease YdiL (CAAX protease family)
VIPHCLALEQIAFERHAVRGRSFNRGIEQVASSGNKRVVVFLLITVGLSVPFWVFLSQTETLYSAGMLLILGVMWAPGLAGLVTQFVFRRSLRGLGWGWGLWRYHAVAYFVPLLACLVVYGITWLSGLGRFSAGEIESGMAGQLGIELPFIVTLLLLSTVGVVLNFIGALGEEIGWRGFLVPELARRWGFTRVALTSGVVWAVYHYPLIFTGVYRGDNPIWYSVVCFTIMIVSMSFAFAWLRLRSGSLWTAVVLHAAHNMFVQSVFDGATVKSGATGYITTEFGAGLALIYTLVAFWFWKRRGELSSAPGTSVVTGNHLDGAAA